MGGLLRFGMPQLTERSIGCNKTPGLSLIGAQEVNSGTAATVANSGEAIAPAGRIATKIINNMDAGGRFISGPAGYGEGKHNEQVLYI